MEASFFKRMSPVENLSYSARFYGLGSARDARARSREILSRSAFRPSARGEPMEDLSRGMQQKIALARALLTAPVLLLLDEPTTGLDPRSKLEVQAFIRSMREQHDSTILLCTHDMAEAEALADRVGILHEGELLCLDTADAIKAATAPTRSSRRSWPPPADRSRTRRTDDRRSRSAASTARAGVRRELIGFAGIVERNDVPDPPVRVVGGGVVPLHGREHAHDRLHRQGRRGRRRHSST